MTKRCENCKFFWSGNNLFGVSRQVCRRYPPIGPQGWANVLPSNYCGEHIEKVDADSEEEGIIGGKVDE